ncbi:MAG: hypothetical protein KGL52_02030 [Rhodospirillales bacterium]|jgi:hypothetical protein|nr:hypothetical protein [Rhodospirillales bacterium]
MNLPVALPGWLPWWASLVILVAAGLWVLAFILVPFSVIGVKARLEGLEARLDEIQEEIRTLALRLPEQAVTIPFDDEYTIPSPAMPHAEASAGPSRRQPGLSRPPIPPAPPAPRARREPLDVPPPPAPRPLRREGRVEPHLDRRS